MPAPPPAHDFLTYRTQDGQSHHLRDLGPDTWFGEIGILRRSPRTATVTAISDATLFRFDVDDVLDALAESGPSGALLTGMRMRLTSGYSAAVAEHDFDTIPER